MATIVKGVFTSPTTLSGLAGQANDGVAVEAAGERWLDATQTASGGVWVTQAGDWTRAPELDSSSDFVWGQEQTIVRVRKGARFAGSEWYMNSPDNPVLGSDPVYYQLARYGRPQEAEELESYIEGLGLYYVDATTVGLSSGRAYVPGLGKVLTVSSNRTAAVPGAADALNYGFLEEYPAGSGLGRLRLITTPPGVPYLGTAATQSDDATARYLGIVKKNAFGNLVPFESELYGGSNPFVFYNEPVQCASLAVASVVNEPVGPGAATASRRLVSPFARTVYMYANHTAGDSGYTRVGWRPDTTGTQLRVANEGSVFCRLSPAQEARCELFRLSTGSATFFVFGYVERR